MSGQRLELGSPSIGLAWVHINFTDARGRRGFIFLLSNSSWECLMWILLIMDPFALKY